MKYGREYNKIHDFEILNKRVKMDLTFNYF
jgi:hypothetical protein